MSCRNKMYAVDEHGEYYRMLNDRDTYNLCPLFGGTHAAKAALTHLGCHHHCSKADAKYYEDTRYVQHEPNDIFPRAILGRFRAVRSDVLCWCLRGGGRRNRELAPSDSPHQHAATAPTPTIRITVAMSGQTIRRRVREGRDTRPQTRTLAAATRNRQRAR